MNRACLDDRELLALVEHRLAAPARLHATAHLDACAQCMELVVELVRGGLGARAQQALEGELEL